VTIHFYIINHLATLAQFRKSSLWDHVLPYFYSTIFTLHLWSGPSLFLSLASLNVSWVWAIIKIVLFSFTLFFNPLDIFIWTLDLLLCNISKFLYQYQLLNPYLKIKTLSTLPHIISLSLLSWLCLTTMKMSLFVPILF